MDDSLEKIEEELRDTLQRAARLAAEVGRRRVPPGEVPHYSQIESQAHAVAQQLGQSIQAQRTEQISQGSDRQASCPGCRRQCHVNHRRRTITSLDGPTEITEAVARCRHCRRSFFPSA